MSEISKDEYISFIRSLDEIQEFVTDEVITLKDTKYLTVMKGIYEVPPTELISSEGSAIPELKLEPYIPNTLRLYGLVNIPVIGNLTILGSGIYNYGETNIEIDNLTMYYHNHPWIGSPEKWNSMDPYELWIRVELSYKECYSKLNMVTMKDITLSPGSILYCVNGIINIE